MKVISISISIFILSYIYVLTLLNSMSRFITYSVTEIKLACDMDKESFKSRYGFEKPDCEDDLVVCCKSGVRSKTACDLLQAKGFKRHR